MFWKGAAMKTVKDLLTIARKELGNTESPAGSNKTKYGRWFGLDGNPWCMMFVMWCFDQAGVVLPARTASCGELMRAAQAAGCWVTTNFQPGDVVIYDFSGQRKTTQHCGIVEMELPGYGVQAIEGNTSVSGSQSNGGMVCRKTRKLYTARAFLRPDYTTNKEVQKMDNTPSSAHKTGVNWAVQNGILNGNQQGDLMLSKNITRQQLCTMLYNYHKKFGEGK